MASTILASAADDEAEFLTALRAALEKKDATSLVAMHCFDGFDEPARKAKEKQIPLLYFRDALKSAEYVPPVDPPPSKEHEGVTYSPNLKPEKAVLVKFQRADSPTYSSETRLWIGRKDGRLLIILTPPEIGTSMKSSNDARSQPSESKEAR